MRDSKVDTKACRRRVKRYMVHQSLTQLRLDRLTISPTHMSSHRTYDASETVGLGTFGHTGCRQEQEQSKTLIL